MAQNYEIIKDSNISQSVTLHDNDLDRIRKKTERLASAIYLLTDFFSDKEPLKWLLRKRTLRIIPKTISLKLSYLPKEKKENILNDIEVSTMKSVSLLETAYMGGLISEMNFSILQKEFNNLINMGKSYGKSISNLNQNLKKDFFQEDLYKTDYKGHHNYNMSDRGVSYNNSQKYKSSGQLSNLADNKPLEKKDKEESDKKNKRQLKIIEIIKDKKEVSIKDIADMIKDCSEKTIQRELMSLVQSGVLKKEGEKRWSKYSLNL